MTDVVIGTERLNLRGWRDDDGPAFLRATNTSAVMAHLGGVEDEARLLSSIPRQQAMQAERGHCFWLVERKADGELLGFCGLKAPVIDGTPIAGETEIGWRLAEHTWGQSYAREAAAACLAWGWEHTSLPRIVAMTVAANTRSWGLMERLGMTRRPDLAFDHPSFAAGHPLRANIVHAIDRP